VLSDNRAGSGSLTIGHKADPCRVCLSSDASRLWLSSEMLLTITLFLPSKQSLNFRPGLNSVRKHWD